MHHHVRAELEWLLQQRRGPGIVTGNKSVSFSGNRDDSADVGDMKKRIGRSFKPDESSGRLDGPLHRGEILHVHQRVLNTVVSQPSE